MKIELEVAITQALKYYVEKEISGKEFSRILSQNFDKAEGLDKKQQIAFKYYVDFFEKEGKELYLDSNIYLKDEVDELSQFIEALVAG